MTKLFGWLLGIALLTGSALAQEKKDAAPEVKKDEPAATNEVAVIKTSAGEMVLEFWPDVAPKHVENFKKLAKQGFYDGTAFHRIVKGFMIQGGDPLTKDESKASQYGTGGLGLLKAELSDHPFARGTVAAVRRPSSLDSAGTQFFVCLQPQPSLAKQYTVFGEVVSGMEVVDQISTTPVDGDKAKERVPMKVTIREAPPAP